MKYRQLWEPFAWFVAICSAIVAVSVALMAAVETATIAHRCF